MFRFYYFWDEKFFVDLRRTLSTYSTYCSSLVSNYKVTEVLIKCTGLKLSVFPIFWENSSSSGFVKNRPKKSIFLKIFPNAAQRSILVVHLWDRISKSQWKKVTFSILKVAIRLFPIKLLTSKLFLVIL
jgi:hypothetical protein